MKQDSKSHSYNPRQDLMRVRLHDTPLRRKLAAIKANLILHDLVKKLETTKTVRSKLK